MQHPTDDVRGGVAVRQVLDLRLVAGRVGDDVVFEMHRQVDQAPRHDASSSIWPTAVHPEPLLRALADPRFERRVDGGHHRHDIGVAVAGARHVERRVEREPETRAAEFSKSGRAALLLAIKSAEIPLTGTRGFAKAEVTAGGIALDEVDSRTMQSKLVPGLYFAGEILDLDGPIGGYNFQAAFSTGVLAGRSV